MRSPTNNFKLIQGDIEDLDLIQDLWMELRLHIKGNVDIFKKEFENMPFHERKKILINKSDKGLLKLFMVEDGPKNIIGYCISTISPEKIGEVDSIYVKENYQSRGIGEILMEQSLRWMDENHVKSKKIYVTVGNHDVMAFYKKYGFHPRSIVLKYMEDELDDENG
jgi:ribosomal protein S18 acetylase RimI-like enzyme